MIFAIVVLLVVIVLTASWGRPRGALYLRRLALPVLCMLFVLCLILFSDSAVKAAKNGLTLWAGVVVPSLFPFFVASEIMNSTGFIRTSGILLEPVMRPVFNVPGCASFALLLGITSGYPVGAKITADLRRNGLLNKTEAERLLAFTNNSGPLFIVGAVGTGMYGSSGIGIFLLVCHVLSCLTVGFLFRFYKRGGRPAAKAAPKKKLLREFKSSLASRNAGSSAGFGTTLGDAIKNSISTVLAIGGFIVLFSVIIQLLAGTGIIGALAGGFARILSPVGLNRDIMAGILSGFFEITTGSGIVSRIISLPIAVRLPAASFIIGWAGLSVHFQVMGITSGTDIRIRPYLCGKLLQGVIAAIYTGVGMNLFPLEALAVKPVLGLTAFDLSNFLQLFGKSLFLVLAALAGFITTCGLVSRFRARRKHRTV